MQKLDAEIAPGRRERWTAARAERPRSLHRNAPTRVVLVIAGTLAMAACSASARDPGPLPTGDVAAPPFGFGPFCRRHPDQCGGRAEPKPEPPLLMARAGSGAPQTASATSAVRQTPAPPHAAGFAPAPAVPAQARPDVGADGRLILTPAARTLLEDVNRRINRALTPLPDRVHYGRVEHWTLPLREGRRFADCEDYALEKRRALIAAGAPETALRLAVGQHPHAGRHAVLIAATDQGDLVLDNRTSAILPWSHTSYDWLKVQTGHDAWAWRLVDAGSQRG